MWWQHETEIARPDLTPDDTNFWACANGHSEPSRDGERAVVGRSASSGAAVVRCEPCHVCGGEMRLLMRSGVGLRNTWGE